MAFFLGIDGGGTKTECAVADEQRMLARATGGTIKIKKIGNHAAEQTLAAVIREVCAGAGITSRNFTRTCIGISGASIPEVREWSERVLGELVSGDLTVVGDTIIAHRAAFHGGAGVLVIAGTGSNVLGFNAQGECTRAGGWGPVISDEGSGFWIGRRAASEAMRAHDAQRPTLLLKALLSEWKLGSLEEFVSLANSSPPPDFSLLFPAVQRCAEQGDALARELLSAAGNELAQLALTVVRKLWSQPSAVTVATTGGVFAHSPEVRGTFANILRTQHPSLTLNTDLVEPVLGALELAKQPR